MRLPGQPIELTELDAITRIGTITIFGKITGHFGTMIFRDIVVLQRIVLLELPDAFYQQSLGADRALRIIDVIMPNVIAFIKKRYKTSDRILKIALMLELLTVRQKALLINQLFGNMPRTDTTVDHQCNNDWGFDMNNKHVEE